MTGRLTDRQVEDLVNLVRDAIDAMRDRERARAKPCGTTGDERADWARQGDAAADAALAAERAAVQAIRALRGAS